MLAAFMGERRLENRHGGNFRQLFARRAKLESRLEARRGDRTAELQAVQKEIAELGRRRQGLERQIKNSQLAVDVPIRLIGEEVAGLSCYFALVANKYAGGAGTQKAHALLDPSWTQPQIIHV